jgi:hypothetical protein
MERHRVYDLLDQLWVRDASDEQLAHFRDFSDTVQAIAASDGDPWTPSPRYWCVLREIERRQLAQVCGGGSLNHREVRRV